ncbi:hypothetical protein C0992_001416 [Termitomyces sp. T32_za158]|nr:hypothetical protein C0992_001416 [Termitomyces sp. T32_za158]
MAGLLHPTSGIPHSAGFPGGRNHDYTTLYGPEKPGEELKENARVWNVYLDEAHEYDMDMIEGFRNILDGLLVFAALFSAVVTTFVAQTSQALQPDNMQIMVSQLIETNQLLRAAGNKTSINTVPTASLGPESQTHTSIDVWVNGLFFTSLALSLSTALLSVLAKQWIQAYIAVVPGSAKIRAVTRHFRFQGLEKWKLGDIIESLPLILHCSVAIFLIGLVLYISQLSRPLCGIIAVITAFTFVFYFGSSMISAFDVACPYRIPFMFLLAQFLLFVFYLIQDAYLSFLNKTDWSWPQMNSWSLKAVEQNRVSHKSSDFPYHLVHNSLDWVFNHSSNHSVKEIVMEGTCGLLDELCSVHWNALWSIEHLLSFHKVEDNFMVSTITYALSRLPDMSQTSSKEENVGDSTVHGRLLATLKKFPFKKAQVIESTTDSKDEKQLIMDALLDAYRSALIEKHHTLSQFLLELSGHLFQLDSGWNKFLRVCAWGGDAQDLHDLVNQGIDLNWHDSDGWTALHYAAFNGNMDVVIALVEQKPTLMSAPADWMGVSQLTPLDIAVSVYKRKPDVLEYLLKHGAKSISHNALYCILRFSFYTPLEHIQLLLDCGWDRTVKDNQDETLLDVAHSKGDSKLIELLEQTVRPPSSANISHTVD